MNRETPANTNDMLPKMIAVRTAEFEPLLTKWRASNKEVPWSRLLARALRKELAPIAGKRYAHLVEEA